MKGERQSAGRGERIGPREGEAAANRGAWLLRLGGRAEGVGGDGWRQDGDAREDERLRVNAKRAGDAAGGEDARGPGLGRTGAGIGNDEAYIRSADGGERREGERY